MESISGLSSQFYPNSRNSIYLRFQLSNPSILSFPYRYTTFSALKTTTAGGGSGRDPQHGGAAADLLRKPVVEVKDHERGFLNGQSESEDYGGKTRGVDNWVDWEDQILEETVPLIGFVRMILHSGKYENGERLSSEHENIVIGRLLAYHPESEKKIGRGIDYVMVGQHPDFESSRCLFIVRKNGELVDFSYWKCIKGLIRKKYPMHAESFILQHFKQRR